MKLLTDNSGTGLLSLNEVTYTSCRHIQCPGARPIGLGEVVQRIIGKEVMRIVKCELQGSVGSVQLCVGQDAGCEAAIHAM